MPRLVAAVGVACVLLLGACGTDTPKYGRVLDRKFIPSHDDWHPGLYLPGSTHCSSTGKTTSCYTSPPIFIPPHTDHVPDKWRVKLTDGEHEGWRTVPQAKYDECYVGEHCDTRS